MRASVSIIIPMFNELHYTRQCLATLQANTEVPHKLILVDNGSTDGTGDFLDTIAGACVIHSETNRGFAGGVNLGLEHAEGHVLLLNNDTLLSPHWLQRLVAALERFDDMGMVGPRSNCVSGDQQIDGPEFRSQAEIDAFSEALSVEYAQRMREVERLVGFCLLIRDEAFAKVGLFDERFETGNYEDDDYCLRVRAAGYRLCIADDCFVYHYGSRTFAGLDLVGDRYGELLERNRRKFLDKWLTQPERQRSMELNRQARAARERGDVKEAIRLLVAAIELHPTGATNHNDLGVLLWEAGEMRLAVEQFDRALRLDPLCEDAQENRARAVEAVGLEGDRRDG